MVFGQEVVCLVVLGLDVVCLVVLSSGHLVSVWWCLVKRLTSSVLDKVVVCLVVLGQEVNCLSGMLGQESVYLVVLVKKNCLPGGVGSRGCVLVCLLVQVYWVKRMSVWNVRSGDFLSGSVSLFSEGQGILLYYNKVNFYDMDFKTN